VTALFLTALLAAAPQQPSVFKAEVGVVRVEVSVTTDGQPVGGLTAADFELRDNGRTQELRLVLEEQAPIDAVLVLDMSWSVRGAKRTALRGAAAAFLDGLRPTEMAAVVGFHHEILLLQDFTSERSRLFEALERAQPFGSTALRDAVYAALRLRPPTRQRVTIVVFSDGVDNVSLLTPSEVVEAAAHTDGIVYGIGVRPDGDARETFLPEAARATGGRYFEAASERDLRRRFLDVLADIRSRYVLSYSPADAPEAGWHTLTLRLKRRKGDVLARRGYWR
jgi:Ca-activated chloride channel homolog